MLKDGTFYQERGPGHFDKRRNDRQPKGSSGTSPTSATPSKSSLSRRPP
jgi:hypothetical protein